MEMGFEMKPIVFITGANGFIGQRLVSHLAGQGYPVFALIRKNSLPKFQLGPNIHVRYGDITEKKSISAAMPARSIVIHLAANPYHKTLSYQVNVLGTKNVLDVAKHKKIQRFVHISSQATKIENKGVYAETKIQSDELVQQSGLTYLIIKPSLVYGPGSDGLFAKVAALAKKLPFIPVFGNGNVRLYPIHVDDMCTFIEHLALDRKIKDQSIDLGGNSPITYNQLYLSISSFLPNKPPLMHIPVSIGLFAAKIFSLLPHPPIYRDNILGSTQDTFCHPQPLLKRYSFIPRSFSIGIQEIFQEKKIRVGIIGLGKMGMLHATLLTSFPNVQIAALIDTNPVLYKTFKSMGIEGAFYSSLDAAQKDVKLDAVYITTPTFTHFQLLKKALQQKLHVFIEKPVTLNTSEIVLLKKLHPKTLVHAGYTLLFHRTHQELMRILQESRFGKLLSYEATFEHGEVLSPKKGWMFNPKLSGGGVLMNPGPHLFSLITACFGQPKKVNGTLRRRYSELVEDEAYFTASHGSFSGKISLSWSKHGKHVAEYSIICVFEKATVVVTNAGIQIKKNKRNEYIPFEELPPAVQDPFTLNPDAFGEAYYAEDLAFADAVHSGKSVQTNSLQFALLTEEFIQQCYKQGKYDY
jgi:predicted dehydrogenase/nucleoside-diphosphate-sugar epimerase